MNEYDRDEWENGKFTAANEINAMLKQYANESCLANARAARQTPPYFDSNDVGRADFWIGPNATQGVLVGFLSFILVVFYEANCREKKKWVLLFSFFVF